MALNRPFCTAGGPPNDGSGKRKMIEGYHKTYKHDPRVSMILRSTSHNLNMLEKQRYNTLIKFCADSLFRNYGKKTEHAQKQADEFVNLITSTVNTSDGENKTSSMTNLDSRSFLLFLKHLNEFQNEVLANSKHEITPQSFLVLLDKLSNLTNSEKMNEFLMRRISNVNLQLLNTDKILKSQNSQDASSRFEENVRIEEIKKFASDVVPEARFIFDNYKVSKLTEVDTSQKGPERKFEGRKRQEEEDSGEEDNFKEEKTGLRTLQMDQKDPSMQQYTEPEDYFSFFSSHEKLLLRPEKSFKHLRKFVKYLPIDYYVLLQENYHQKIDHNLKKPSTCIMFRNLPIILRNLTKFKKYVYRQVKYEDISRCQDTEEIHQLLDEQIAVDELKEQLSRYGPVGRIQLFNTKEELARIVAKSLPKPTKDKMEGFEQMMQQVVENNQVTETEDGFEKILRAHRNELLRHMSLKATKSNVEIAKGFMELTLEERERISASIFRKGRQMRNLNRGVFTHGILEFGPGYDYDQMVAENLPDGFEEYYKAKLGFMLSPGFQFGIKFYDQQNHIQFSDADFGNVLSVGSSEFDNRSLSDVCSIVNTMLINSGFSGQDLCMVGDLTALPDVQLENAQVRPGTSISIRFHNFHEAREAFYFLNTAPANIRVKFANPNVSYYDGKFATAFESAIKNKFSNLDKIIEIPSNYAKTRLASIQSENGKFI